MNTVWSSCIQDVGTLYLSRKLRFSDELRGQFCSAFDLGEGGAILEIGCGPGALAASLARWYPKSRITALDRDTAFLAFARQHVAGVEFLEGDATALPFAADSFDVTISNTVSEHVDPAKFFPEQLRVLKPGGVCLVLSSRQVVQVGAQCLEESDWERELWQRTEASFREAFQAHQVGKFAMDAAELPLTMEKLGFREVTTAYIPVALTPDDPRNTPERAQEILLSQRQNDLDNADHMLHLAGDVVSPEEIRELKRRICQRYDRRLQLYRQGIRQWDTDVCLISLVRGIK